MPAAPPGRWQRLQRRLRWPRPPAAQRTARSTWRRRSRPSPGDRGCAGRQAGNVRWPDRSGPALRRRPRRARGAVPADARPTAPGTARRTPRPAAAPPVGRQDRGGGPIRRRGSGCATTPRGVGPRLGPAQPPPVVIQPGAHTTRVEVDRHPRAVIGPPGRRSVVAPPLAKQLEQPSLTSKVAVGAAGLVDAVQRQPVRVGAQAQRVPGGRGFLRQAVVVAVGVPDPGELPGGDAPVGRGECGGRQRSEHQERGDQQRAQGSGRA